MLPTATDESKTTSGTTYNYYYHGDTVLNETKTTSGTTSNYATNIIGVTGIEARNQSGTTGFFEKDLHGDVRYAFNSSCTKIADYTYDAWGNDATLSTSTWAQNNPVRYNGQYLDSETGMYYLRARYYDPQMSRFISEDPAEDGVNWYAYCSNNPVMFVDPSGLVKVIVQHAMHKNQGTSVYYKDSHSTDVSYDVGKEVITIKFDLNDQKVKWHGREIGNFEIIDDRCVVETSLLTQIFGIPKDRLIPKKSDNFRDLQERDLAFILSPVIPLLKKNTNKVESKGIDVEGSMETDGSYNGGFMRIPNFVSTDDFTGGSSSGGAGQAGPTPTPPPFTYPTPQPGQWDDLPDIVEDMNGNS